jgi:hypothetical protein
MKLMFARALLFVVMCAAGCGHIAIPQQLGAESPQSAIATGTQPEQPESSSDDTFVADIECPPVETAAANLRGGVACSHAALPSAAVAAHQDGELGDFRRKAGIDDGVSPELPTYRPAAAITPNQQKQHPEMGDEEENKSPLTKPTGMRTGGRAAIIKRAIDEKSASGTGAVKPTMAMACEPQWIEWNEFRYDCCTPKELLPEEVVSMCRHTNDDNNVNDD